MRPCYRGNSSKPEPRGEDEKSRHPQKRQSSVCHPPFYPRRKAFPLEGAWEWVVGSKPTGNEGLWGVKWCGHWLFTGAQGMWAPRGGQRRKENQCPAGRPGWVQVGLGGSRPGALSPPGPRFWDLAKKVRSCLTPSKGVHLCWWQLGSRCTPQGLPCSALGSCSVGLQLCVWS